MKLKTPLCDLLNIRFPIIQAPMAGANGIEMALAVSQAGAMGSIPCAILSMQEIGRQVDLVVAEKNHSFNVNFFCHQPEEDSPERQHIWKSRLSDYYRQEGLDPSMELTTTNRAPFDEEACKIIERSPPRVVSFHFGLPEKSLVNRVKAAGCLMISSATSVQEALWLEQQGCDAVIAQGSEAGGHRGMFLEQDISQQIGTMALVPQIVDAVSIPVIAAGGITDARGVAAALMLGASAVQMGTAFLLSPQSLITDLHRKALTDHDARETALTNVFSGRPARSLINRLVREQGPMSAHVPPFPTAGGALAPLKKNAEIRQSAEFSSLWSGQAGALAKTMDAAELVKLIANETQLLLDK